MSWQILITISILSGVSATLLHRKLLKDNHHHSTGMAILTDFFSAAMIAVALIFIGFDTDWDQLPWGNVALAMVLWTITDILMNRSMKKYEASIFNVLFATRSFWAIIAAIIFLDDEFLASDWIGTFIMGGAVLMVVYERGIKWKFKPVILALATAFVMGMALTNDGIVLEDGYHVPSYYLFAFLGPTVAMSLISKEGIQSVKHHFHKGMRRYIIGLGALHAISGISLFYAFQDSDNLSVLLALIQVQTVLVAVGAVILLKERTRIWLRIIAALLTAIGVYLIVAD